MQDMIFKTYLPNRFLQPFLSRIFVFESKSGMSKNDFGLIAPNGKMKLVIPYRNNMKSTINHICRVHKESSCFMIGHSMHSAITECDKDYGNICVEFNPAGVYRFFNLPLNEIAGQIYDTHELYGKVGKELREKVSETADIDKKVLLVQDFLYRQMVQFNKSDAVSEYAINKIIMSKGLININSISEEMGYSRRYLLRKFTENLGISPKEFACIIRFDEIFKKVSLHHLSEEKLYEYYYDQSHFIKEFKKFTGFTPGDYICQSNKLGILLYE